MNNPVVAECNNLGIAYLDAGELKSAQSHFCEALRMTMGALEQGPIPFPDDGWGARNENGESTRTEIPLSLPRASDHFLQEMTEIVLPTEKPPPPATAVFAYTRGFNLIPCRGAYSPNLMIDTTVVSCIIIFNLTIVYHMNGLKGGDQGHFLIGKAKSLYQTCHQMLAEGAGVPLSTTGNPVIDMLSMALFNNLAHVSFELGLFDDTKHYFELLGRFSHTVSPERYGDDGVGMLLEQQKALFLLNWIILQVPKVAAAA